jgi:uncharacterized protein (DUF433 family)
MKTEYVEKRDEGYWVSGSRVSLASIVYAFLNGQTAESIAQSFPTLSLEQVYGAITYYLAHRSEVDAYLREADLAYEAQRAAERAADPMFYKKLADARQHRSGFRVARLSRRSPKVTAALVDRLLEDLP